MSEEKNTPRWRRTHLKSQAATPDQNVNKSIAGDNSEVEDLSDNDDPVEDFDYHPPQQEPSSSEEESSGNEDPTPQSAEAIRGHVGLSRLSLMAQTMILKSQHQDQAFKDNPSKDKECAGGLLN
ncbi:unnamed protein product [Leuciscus chuanchicus]